MGTSMSWKECIDQGIIRKTDPDYERSIQLLKMATVRNSFWNRKIPAKFTSLKVEAYYEIIKELILAHLYQQGYSCSNHLCLIAYLKTVLTDMDYEIEKIDELRQVRNEISYRGFSVDVDYLTRNELEFQNIIKQLRVSIES